MQSKDMHKDMHKDMAQGDGLFMAKDINVDVVIAGTGVAGLFTALHLPAGKRVLMICKEDMESCDSMLAQGGICVLKDADD